MKQQHIPPLFVISGGVGASGEQLVNTVLAQFPDQHVPVVIINHVRNAQQITAAIAQAHQQHGAIAHTLVDGSLRQQLIAEAQHKGVPAFDLMGPLLTYLANQLGEEPAGQPGLYRQLHRSYFERITAIEYTMNHDDGQRREDWSQADMVLIGVSRTGKTPLSIYLSVLGFKVANVPLVPETAVDPQLFQLDRTRVVGLTIELDRLLTFRRQRSSQMGISRALPYADPTRIAAELDYARRVYRQGRFVVVDVTDKTVEASANEIIHRVERTHGMV